MVTKRLRKSDHDFLKELGKRVSMIILKEKKYSSFDAFALEFYDKITKPTLYQIAEGKRDMKISTLRRLAEVLDISLERLISGL